MSQFAGMAAGVAKQFGIPPGLFVALVNQESGFNPNARSSAGATGLTQLMPGTARGLGVNLADPHSQLVGGAKYLKEQFNTFHSWPLALAAYNAGPGAVSSGAWRSYPETTNYVKSITSAAPRYGSVASVASTAPVPGAVPPGVPQIKMPVETGGGLDVNLFANDELSHLGNPGFALKGLASGSYDQPFSEKLMKISGMPVPQVRGGAPSRQSREGKVTVSAGANRSGVGLKPEVLDFVSLVAGVFGHPLTIGTGTNHQQYVAGENHVQSEHWTGNAADIPASGQTLTRLGQDALIAAGMNPAKARAQRGGVYNLTVGGRHIQILFNTHVGGNHFTHVHVGVH